MKNFNVSVEDVQTKPASIGHKWSTASDDEWNWFRLVCKHLGIPNPPQQTKSNTAFRYVVERLAVALEEGKAEINWLVDDASELTQPADFDITSVDFDADDEEYVEETVDA